MNQAGKIEIKDLRFSYPGSDKLILENINASFDDGEFVCILGQSGCGKSTLLRLIAGLETVTGGEVLMHGEPITDAGLDRGVVFQDYGLFPWMTAGDNITLAIHQRFPPMSKDEQQKLACDMLEKVGLEREVFKKLPKELSGGMKQRCAIAQAFAIDPPIFLMDEPFGALDAVTRAKLQDLVLELWRGQTPRKSVFFVTHDVDEAILLANRIIVLGQRPSSIIFDIKVDDDFCSSREHQYDNPEVAKLRGELVRQINQDVAERVDK